MKISKYIALLSCMIFLLGATQIETYKYYKPCSFSVQLPSSYSLNVMEIESSPDYCDYAVKTKNGKKLIELHSLVKGRFMKEDTKSLYLEALKTIENDVDVTYKKQNNLWFVISGIVKSTKKVYYWKRSVGKYFISDLNIEYAKEDAKLIEPHLGKISGSFVSD